MADKSSPWLLLIHQIPPKPAYFRVKIWRHLQSLGAVALKNSVYVLPGSEECREDFQWVIRQIVAGGGEASALEARFVEGFTDGEVRERFRTARDKDYAQLLEEILTALKALSGKAKAGRKEEAGTQLAKFRKRLAEIQAIDFFEAKGGAEVRTQLGRLESVLAPGSQVRPAEPQWRIEDLRGRTWVTRKGIHVDRIACAWLIRRFIDPEARFRFVDPRTAQVRKRELRFDMFEGEFTHEGDGCSFETFLQRLALEDPALHALAELVHDVDLKDEKFKRPEVAGFDRAILGVAMLHARDEDRLTAGYGVLDAFHAAFSKLRPERGTTGVSKPIA